jgi:hypothetical protein
MKEERKKKREEEIYTYILKEIVFLFKYLLFYKFQANKRQINVSFMNKRNKTNDVMQI